MSDKKLIDNNVLRRNPIGAETKMGGRGAAPASDPGGKNQFCNVASFN